MTEQWRKISGFDFYKISDKGRVKSFYKKPIILKPGTDTKGYLYVSLTKDKTTYPRRVHLLVLETFRRPRKEHEQGRHLDGNKRNNDLQNLKYGSRKINEKDKNGYGKNTRGNLNGEKKGKLMPKDVVVIWNMLHRKELSHEKIAAKFKVSRALISRINTQVAWNINTWDEDLKHIKRNIINGIHKDTDLFLKILKVFKLFLSFKNHSNYNYLVKRYNLYKKFLREVQYV